MEPKKKQTRKSVPRPNSGRRAVDGAMDLVKVGVRLSKEQHEWVKANGQHALRQLIQAHIDEAGTGLSIASVGSVAEDVRAKVYGLTNYGVLTTHQKAYWRKQCERYGIPVPDGLKN